MFVMITETGEVRQLSFIDWQDRLEYAESLISHSADASNFIFDAETETFSTANNIKILTAHPQPSAYPLLSAVVTML